VGGLGAGEVVDVELAAQVVGFVLQAAGQFAGSGHHDPLLAEVHPDTTACSARDRMAEMPGPTRRGRPRTGSSTRIRRTCRCTCRSPPRHDCSTYRKPDLTDLTRTSPSRSKVSVVDTIIESEL